MRFFQASILEWVAISFSRKQGSDLVGLALGPTLLSPQATPLFCPLEHLHMGPQRSREARMTAAELYGGPTPQAFPRSEAALPEDSSPPCSRLISLLFASGL